MFVFQPRCLPCVHGLQLQPHSGAALPFRSACATWWAASKLDRTHCVPCAALPCPFCISCFRVQSARPVHPVQHPPERAGGHACCRPCRTSQRPRAQQHTARAARPLAQRAERRCSSGCWRWRSWRCCPQQRWQAEESCCSGCCNCCSSRSSSSRHSNRGRHGRAQACGQQARPLRLDRRRQ